MANLDSIKINSKPKVHTKLGAMLSLLKAFKLAELLTMANNFLAIFAIVYSPTLPLKALASLVLILGLLVFYYAIRIRIDINLFESWDSLDMAALDQVLANINPKFQSARTLAARLQGSFKLFNQGLIFLLAQFCILLLALWII